MKVDELFLRRLSKTDRHPALHNGLPHIQGENSDPRPLIRSVVNL